MGEREVHVETDWWGDEVEVIYEDGVKVGEYRLEERDPYGFGFFAETVKVEYDADGIEVGLTRHEERDPTGLGVFAEDVEVEYDSDGRQIGWSRVEERGGIAGIGAHHERIGYNNDDEEVSQTSWERRGGLFGIGDERVRVTRREDDILIAAHRSADESASYTAAPTEASSSGIGVLTVAAILLTVIVVAIAAHDARPVAGPTVTIPPAPLSQHTMPTLHVRTWVFGPGGGAGVEVSLTSVNVGKHETVLTFHVVGGSRRDILLYEPPKPEETRYGAFGAPIAEDFDELYLLDAGQRLKSTSGFQGGSQSSFNNYNLVRRINITAGEEVDLTVRFPPLRKGARVITFVSPALDGWQDEWRQDIDLRNAIHDPEN